METNRHTKTKIQVDRLVHTHTHTHTHTHRERERERERVRQTDRQAEMYILFEG